MNNNRTPASGSSPTTIAVNKGQSIQAAINAAKETDTLAPTAGVLTFSGVPAAGCVIALIPSDGSEIIEITEGAEWSIPAEPTAATCAAALATAAAWTQDGATVIYTFETPSRVAITDTNSKLTNAYTAYAQAVVEPVTIERKPGATWDATLPVPTAATLAATVKESPYEGNALPVRLNAPAAVVWRWDDFRADTAWWTTANAAFPDAELGGGANAKPIDYLARRGIHITVGVIGSDLGRYVTGADLAAMIKAGHEIWAHSWNHSLATIPDSAADIQREIIDPKRVIEGAIHAADANIKYDIPGYIFPGVWTGDYVFGSRTARNNAAARAVRDTYRYSQCYSGQGIIGGGISADHFSRPSITAIDAMTGANVVKVINQWALPGNILLMFMHKAAVADATVKTIADGIYAAMKAGKITSIPASTAYNCILAPRVSADAKFPVGSLLPAGNFDISAVADLALTTSMETYGGDYFDLTLTPFAGTAIHNALYPAVNSLDVAAKAGTSQTRLYEPYWWCSGVPGGIYDFAVTAKTPTAGNGATFALYAELCNAMTGSLVAGNTIANLTVGGTLTDEWQRFVLPVPVTPDCMRIRLHVRCTTNTAGKGMSIANVELNRVR